ncbi:MAG: DNA-processing protein DprA [Bacteroidales bacterium]|nr:DNA-processing protein DprA [Candidatus Equibacterium intestinale]
MRQDLLIYTAAVANSFPGRISKLREIIDIFGDAEKLFSLPPAEAMEVCPLIRTFADRLYSAEALRTAEQEIMWAESHGIDILCHTDRRYPSRLKECPDAPLILYRKGSIPLSGKRIVAIVGTRGATQYGKRYCDSIIEKLSELKIKPVVVSGLALGIDTYAHTFALRYGLKTIAVMGTGFNTVYPAANENLAGQILDKGALVSEFSHLMPSLPQNFVRRNRIIAGLSDCILLVESRIKGGGLITADFGLHYNRSVFAVPGRIDDNSFKGCNALIENNAASIATGGESIIKGMNWDMMPRQPELDFGSEDEDAESDAQDKSDIKSLIYKYIDNHPDCDISQISEWTGTPTQNLAMPLLELEMSGRIRVVSGNRYCSK